MVRLPVRLFHRPPNEPPPEPPDDPPKPPPEKEPPEPPKLPEPPDEEDGAAAEIVLRTSAKLELSCAPRSPKFALNAAGSIVEAPSDVPTDAPSRLLERKGMYMYEVPACSSNHWVDRPLRDMLWLAGPSPSWKCRTRWHTPCTGPTTRHVEHASVGEIAEIRKIAFLNPATCPP